MGRINQRLNGLNPLAYLGDNSYQPPEFVTDNRAPTANDVQNFELGTLWLNTTTNPPTTQDVWMLVSQVGGSATWVNFAGGSSAMKTLTGDSGGVVFPTANNTNIVGSGVITVVGNPGTSTLTITPSGIIASSFPTDSGTAVPAAGVLTVTGGTGIGTTGAGSTVTINADATVPLSFPTDSGTATPAANALTIAGSHGVNTSGSGATVTVAINNTITLGDLSVVTSGNPSVTLTSGDLTLSGTGVNAAGNINLPTNSASRLGVITTNGSRFIHSYPGLASQNPAPTFIGSNSGNFTHTSAGGITAIGGNSLQSLTTAVDVTVIGQSAGIGITTGSRNTIIGKDSALLLANGAQNTLIGNEVAYNTGGLTGLVSGSNNIAIGYVSGGAWTGAESNNISIGPSSSVVGESNVIRVQNGISAYTKCFIQGIRGITTDVNDAVAVLIDSAGQLGTVSSSIRFKENVEDMADHSSALMMLRPVVFNYKDDVDHNLQTGLIAEEVLEKMPKLVVHDEDGLPLTIKYHDLGPLLLNELQKLSKRVSDLEQRLAN